MTSGDDSAVLQRLNQLEQALTNGFGALENKLNAALLDQERRNSTFATRDRMDELGRAVQAINGTLVSLNQRLDASGEDRKALRARIDALDHVVSNRSLDALKSATGFMASLLGMILTGLVTFMVTHGVH